MPPGPGRVEFRVLGPLEVIVAGCRVELTGRRARTVLAGLLLEWNRVVPLDVLVRLVWDEDPPDTARKQVQNVVAGLRRRLAGAGAAPDVIETDAAGYRLRVGPGELDLSVFLDRLAAARAARRDGRMREAAAAMQAALASWRGSPLAGVSGTAIEAAAARLAERRVAALEDWGEILLDLGCHDELVPELTAAVAEHPFRERLRAQLMVCLYRSGRQADALAQYREGRDMLVAELGIEPGPELRRTEHAILVGDPALDPPTGESLRPGGQVLPRSAATALRLGTPPRLRRRRSRPRTWGPDNNFGGENVAQT